MRCALLLAALGAFPGGESGTAGDRAADRRPVPEVLGAGEARPHLDRALEFLTRGQNEDGSFGSGVLEGILEMGFSVESFYSWQVASHGLACLALLACEETPERRAALEGAVGWLCDTRMPKRGNHWDADHLWPALYGLVATTEAALDPRFQSDPWQERIARRGREFLEVLSVNQAPEGGWAYYDDPPWTRRPSWSTSFCTALVLPALKRAGELGWWDEAPVLARAVRYVRKCALPGGAYSYDFTVRPRLTGGEHINHLKGSLGRIQVCNWGLATVGEEWVTTDKVREGLDAFLAHHRFLDVARMRPVPHEAYYANAGYFYFFGHYYAAQAIELLPEAERESYRARLRPHVCKVQYEDGSSSDFLASSYMVTASTSFLALTLIHAEGE